MSVVRKVFRGMKLRDSRGRRAGLEAAQREVTRIMNSSGNAVQNESGARSGRKSKMRRKTRGRPRKAITVSDQNGDPELAAPGSLTRTKALLLAALRVWELKHRIGD